IPKRSELTPTGGKSAVAPASAPAHSTCGARRIAVTLLLREDDVRAVLTMPAAIDVLEAAFRQQGRGATRNVPRSRILIPEGRGMLHVLSAYVPGRPGQPEGEGPGLFGLKSYSAYPSSVRFSIHLYSGEDGRLLALIEADWLGQIRTGAASGLATRHMARQDAAVVGLIGTGGGGGTPPPAKTPARPGWQAAVLRRAGRPRRTLAQGL